MPHTHVCSRSIQILCTLHTCMLMFRTFAQEHPCAQSMILCISSARAYFTHLAVLFQRMNVSIQRIMTHAFYTIMLKKYESCTCTQRVVVEFAFPLCLLLVLADICARISVRRLIVAPFPHSLARRVRAHALIGFYWFCLYIHRSHEGRTLPGCSVEHGRRDGTTRKSSSRLRNTTML